MTSFDMVAILMCCAAFGGYLNYRVVRLPATIGHMAFALLLSLGVLLLSEIGWIDRATISGIIGGINFPNLLLHGMLAFLLFAGALQIDIRDLGAVWLPVAILASLGTAMATFITGGLIWLAAHYAGLELPVLYALLFGALISPTDPIAVLSILKQAGIGKDLYVKIGGESLFNDGIGVVAFVAILGAITAPGGTEPLRLAGMLVWQVFGGLGLGAASGWIVYRMLRGIDDYKVEVMLTLALAAGGYALAEYIRVSAPICAVAAGLVIGNKGRTEGMSPVTRTHLDAFWELTDEILNALLFLLIGLEIMVIPVAHAIGWMGLAAIAAVLAGRFVSVAVPISLMRLRRAFAHGTIRLLVWGGLRGGISIAMALSIPDGPEKSLIVPLAYIVVLFSILVQGLSFRRFIALVGPAQEAAD